MFFGNDDDDSDFLSPQGSKLASLFGGSSKKTEGENESLRYTAPKEPKKKKPDTDEGNKSANQTTRLLCAVAVHAYKLVEGKYETQGKIGAAVLADTVQKEYKVLLYKGKQQPVTQSMVSPGFVLTVQKNNYATLYDDMRQAWSLNFESATNMEAFAKQVCIARAASCQGTPDTLVSQDLSYGEGGVLETGDSVEMKYSAWLFDGTTLGAVIDTNNGTGNISRFKLGRGKVIKGWDEGLLGMRKGGRRLLVVPPSLGGGNEMKGKVPANSTVVYEVEVTRVKLNKERETASPRESGNPSPSHTPTPEEDVSNHTDSQINQQPGAQSSKAKLLSRIAKMGQPMLPGMSGGQNEASGDRATEQVSEKTPRSPHQTRSHMDPQPPSPMKPGIPTKPTFQPASHSATHTASQPVTQPVTYAASQPVSQPVNQPVNQPVSQPLAFQPVIPQPPTYNPVQQPLPGAMTSQVALYQSNPGQIPLQYGAVHPTLGPHPPQYGNMYGQPYQQVPAPAPPPQPTQQSSEVVLSESRQTNTEVRLSLSKVQDKVDKIYEKVEGISSHQLHQSTSVMPNMEAGILLHNITRIVQENERLKTELFDKDGKIQHQNEKINELIQRNQKYIEQSQVMLEQRSDTFKLTASQSQDKVLALEQDKVKLTSELSACTSQLSNLQLEITALKKRELELKQQLDSLLTSDQDQKSELSVLRVSNAENEKTAEQLSNQLKDEKRRKKELETQLEGLQEEQSELKSNYHTVEKTLTERKKKFSEERQKLEQEMEEMKSGLEGEIADLKEKLKKQKSSTDVITAEQISKMEEELDLQWKEKNERLLASAQDRHKRALAEVNDEKKELELKIQGLEQKLSTLKSTRGEADGQMVALKEELEDMKVWKNKYDNLRSQATLMKERFEGRVGELEQEVEKVESEKQRTVDRARQAHTNIQSQLVEARDQVSEYEKREQQHKKRLVELTTRLQEMKAEGAGLKDVNTEVKKIMSSVYRSASAKFKQEKSYTGSSVHQTLLSTIKSVTLSLLSGEEVSATQESEESEEEEEEDTEDKDLQSEDEDTSQEKLHSSVDTGDTAAQPESETNIEAETEPEDTVVEQKSDAKSEAAQVQDDEPVTETADLVTSSAETSAQEDTQVISQDATLTISSTQMSSTVGANDELSSTASEEQQDQVDTPKPAVGQETEANGTEEGTKEEENITQAKEEQDITDTMYKEQGDVESTEEVSKEVEDVTDAVGGDTRDTFEQTEEGMDRQDGNTDSKTTEDNNVRVSEGLQIGNTENQVEENIGSTDHADLTAAEKEDVEDVICHTGDTVSDVINGGTEHSNIGEEAERPVNKQKDQTTEEQTGDNVTQNQMTADDKASPVADVQPSAFQHSDSDDDLFKPIPKSRTDAPDEDKDDGKDTAEPAEEMEADEEEDLFKPIPKVKAGKPAQIESEEPDSLFDEPVETKSESAKKTKSETGKKPTKTATASIFDDEDDDGDLFSGNSAFKPKSSHKKEKTPRKEESSDSDDIKEKPPPPPLFGDDEDDDDLDWFSK